MAKIAIDLFPRGIQLPREWTRPLHPLNAAQASGTMRTMPQTTPRLFAGREQLKAADAGPLVEVIDIARGVGQEVAGAFQGVDHVDCPIRVGVIQRPQTPRVWNHRRSPGGKELVTRGHAADGIAASGVGAWGVRGGKGRE